MKQRGSTGGLDVKQRAVCDWLLVWVGRLMFIIIALVAVRSTGSVSLGFLVRCASRDLEQWALSAMTVFYHGSKLKFLQY